MPNLTHRDPLRNGATGRNTTSDDTPRTGLANIDDDLRAEMSRLAAANSEIMKGIRARHESHDEMSQLRAENESLRNRLAELEKYAEALADPAEQTPWEQRQREYEALLEEKSEVIRGLHQQIQELKESGPRQTALADADMNEVEALKAQLEEERRRLREDEEALMAQMREMELAMSRDRAELSRKQAELQRSHSDLAREVEHASRDSGLRDRLQTLARPKTQATLQAPAQSADPEPTKKQSSGLFRRLFGG